MIQLQLRNLFPLLFQLERFLKMKKTPSLGSWEIVSLMVTTRNGQVSTSGAFQVIKTSVTCYGMSSIVPLLHAPHESHWYRISEDEFVKEYINRRKDEDILQLFTNLRNEITYSCSDPRMYPRAGSSVAKYTQLAIERHEKI